MLRPRRASLAASLVVILLLITAGVLAVMSVLMVISARTALMAQLNASLNEAARRGSQFAGADVLIPGPGPVTGPNPLKAPGSPAGQLTVVVREEKVSLHSYRDVEDAKETDLTDADVEALLKAGMIDPLPAGKDQYRRKTVQLSIGEYQVQTTNLRRGSLLITGLPTQSVTDTVNRIGLTAAGGGAVALGLTALTGTWLIRREMRPLERISAVAEEVAALPLESSTADLAQERVPAPLALPGTEVGNVGAALNRMLDNVDSAFNFRKESEATLRAFVADASHELRTPMTAIRGYTDMIKLTENLSDNGRSLLERVESQSARITALIDDLLTLARLDEGRPVERAPVLLNELVVEAVMDVTAVGPDHVWDCDVPGHDVVVQGDGARLVQVMANLLSNARKHTPAGTHVTTSLSTDNGIAVICVDDDGPGIPEEFLSSVFDRFARADASRQATESSTGLGMAITQGIVRAHDGRISVTSRAGEGTTFRIELPLAAARTSD